MSEKKKKQLSIVVFLLFIVGCPILTVLFTKLGLDRYKGIRSEMQFLNDSIRVDFANLPTFGTEALTNESFEGKLVFAGFWDDACKEEMSTFVDSLKSLRDNFNEKDRKKLLFVIHTQDFSQDSTWSLEASIAEWEIDTTNWKFTKGIDRGRYKMKTEHTCFSVAVLDGRVSRKDTSGNYLQGPLLCDYYDLREAEKVENLLRHMAIIMPQKQRKKIEWKQEEKLY